MFMFPFLEIRLHGRIIQRLGWGQSNEQELELRRLVFLFSGSEGNPETVGNYHSAVHGNRYHSGQKVVFRLLEARPPHSVTGTLDAFDGDYAKNARCTDCVTQGTN
jgi:hypothetical protein